MADHDGHALVIKVAAQPLFKGADAPGIEAIKGLIQQPQSGTGQIQPGQDQALVQGVRSGCDRLLALADQLG